MFNRFGRETNWLNILLGLNTIIFIIMYFLSQSLKYDSDYILIGALSTDYVFRGFPWLLVTANFLHFNIIHFVLNAYSLFNIGRIVNEYYPKSTMLTVYMITGLAGSLLTVLAAEILNSPMLSIGASGAIFGLAGLLVGATLKKQRYGYGLPFDFKDIIFPIGLSLLIWILPNSGVNNWAHVGGFAMGIILGLVLKNSLGEWKSLSSIILEKILFYASLLILILSFFLLLFNAAGLILS